MWNSFAIAEFIGFAVAVFILVALIVVLSKNQLKTDDPTNENVKKLNTSVTWLLAIQIASAALMVLVVLVSFLFMRVYQA